MSASIATSPGPRSLARLVALAALAVAARVLYWLATVDYTPYSDAASYFDIASNFAKGNGFSAAFPQIAVHETAFRPPVWPLLLGTLYRFIGVSVGLGRLTNLVIGVALVLLVYWLVARGRGTTAGTVAAVAVAVYPPLVVNDVTLLADSSSLVLLVLVIAMTVDERWVWAGVLTGLLILDRHSAQLFVFVMAVPLFKWLGWKRALGYVGISVAMLVPWVVRNDLQLGAPVLNTANGFNLNAIYSPEAIHDHTFIDAVFDDRFQQYRYAQLDEVEWDRELRKHGLEGMKGHPLALLTVPRDNLFSYFELHPWENDEPEQLDGRNDTVRGASVPIFYAVTIIGLIGLWRARRTRVAMLFMTSAAYFTVVSLMSVPVPRLRAPFDLACCVGLGFLAAEVISRRRAATDRCSSEPVPV